MINHRSIRFRLTVWYTVVLTVGLLIFVAGSTFGLRQAIISSKKQTLVNREGRLLAFLSRKPADGDFRPLNEAVRAFVQPAAPGDILQVFDLSGAMIYPPRSESTPLPWPAKGSCAEPCFGRITLGGTKLQTLEQVATVDGQKVRICMTGSLEEHFDILDRYWEILTVLVPLLSLLSIPAGHLMSKRALQPVDELTKASMTISIGSLSQRLPVPDTDDELQRLAEAWNTLLGRLDVAVTRLTQFTADASHDLRSSISVMMTTCQSALRRRREESEYREALAIIESECRQTSTLLQDLLTLARADIYTQRMVSLPLDFAELAAETFERFRPPAEERSQTLVWDSPVENVQVLGDATLLRRLVAILLDNAIKYTPRSGSIRVSVHKCTQYIELRVEDNGIGIAKEIIPRVFDRFFRADTARDRQGGHGLGLAIAKWIVDAHRGHISLSSSLNVGTIFTVMLPNGSESSLSSLPPASESSR